MPDDWALAIAAARAAGKHALELFGRGVRRWDKSPGNPVCEADLEVDQLLRETLLAARPDDAWLSEETSDDPARLARRRVWVVDPIDGTRDFLRGRSGWAVSVALVEDGQPTVAALAAPARGQLFAAATGRGATLDGAPIRVAARCNVAGLRIPADPLTLCAAYWPEPWEAEPVEKPNALALRVAKVASGEADAFFEGRPMGEWDLAAAALILREAGGRITDREGEQLAFNKPEPQLRGVVAATPALHAEVLRRVTRGINALTAAREI